MRLLKQRRASLAYLALALGTSLVQGCGGSTFLYPPPPQTAAGRWLPPAACAAPGTCDGQLGTLAIRVVTAVAQQGAARYRTQATSKDITDIVVTLTHGTDAPQTKAVQVNGGLGSALFDKLQPGDYQVSAEARANGAAIGKSPATAVKVSAGQTADVSLDIKLDDQISLLGGLSLTARIIDGKTIDQPAPAPEPKLAWTSGPAMPREQPEALAVVDGRAFRLIGGGYRALHLVFDTVSNSWSTGSDVPGDGLDEHFAAAVNGKIYGAGNPFDIKLRIFDLAAGTWSTGNAAPLGNLRRYPAAAAIGNTILVVGGGDGSLAATAATWAYDTAANSWSARASLPASLWGATAVAFNGKMLVFGGSRKDGIPLGTVYSYDPASNGWQTLGPMPRNRFSSGAVVVGDRVYVMGGLGSSGGLREVDVFQPATGQWTVGEPLPQARRNFGAAALAGKIYVAGGFDANGASCGTLYVGTVSTGNPAPGTSLPTR